MKHLLTGILVGLATLLVIPAWAQQDSEVTARITGVSAQDGQLQVGFATTSGQFDQDSIELSVNGEPVQAEVVSLEAADVTRTAVLVIDASNSMRGQPIEQAKQAAIGFVDGVPDEVQVGLVTFNNAAEVGVEPTLDHQAVQAAIDAITLRQRTALYDAVILAAQTAGDEGFRSIVLLSDGRNVGSTATLDEAVAAVENSGITIDAVALGRADVDELTAITSAGNGSVLPAEQAADLVDVFAEQAESVANEVVLVADTAQIPPSGTATVQVTAQADGQTVTADAVVSLGAAPTAEPSPVPPDEQTAAPPAFLSSSWFVPLAVAAVFLGLFGLFLTAFGPFGRRRRDEVTKRLSVYSMSGSRPAEVERKEAGRSSAVAAQALSVADTVVKSRGIEPSLENTLSAADVPMTPAEWLLLHSGATIGGGMLFFLISSFNPWWALLGLLVGLVIPFLVLSVRKSKRQTKFSEQLPDTLTLMAGSLSAGFSLPQAVDSVVREGQQPISEEMQKAIVEARLGVPIEEALENIAVRTQNKDFAWVVMAIRIQRQVGGNLSEILRIVAETLRERAYLRRQVKTLSAEGRISAVIIAAMPFVMLLYLLLVRPEYITLLFTDTLGLIMIFGALILQVVGWFWMRKLVSFEV